MTLRILALSALALFIGALVEHARAGQLFVCEDGSTVEIHHTKLDEAKRSNACVAKHFGLTLPAKAKVVRVKPKAAPVKRRAVPVKPKAVSVMPKAPPVKPTVVAPKPKKAPVVVAQPVAVQPVKKKLHKKPATTVAAPVLRRTRTEMAARRRHDVARKTAAAQPVDYRRIRVINAQSPDSQWFYHKR